MISLKLIKTHYKEDIVNFITFFLTSLFNASFLILFFSAIKYSNKNPGANVTLFFIMFFGITFILSVLLTIKIISLNFKLRDKEVTNMRIIGVKNSKIFKILFLENLIILIPAFIIGIFISIPLNNFILDQLINNGVVNNTFEVSYTAGPIILLIVFILIFILLVTWIPLTKYKVINISNLNSNKESKKAMVWKIIIGTIFLLGFLAMAIFVKENITYLFGGLFFIIGIWLIGEYIVNGILFIITKIFKNTNLIKISFEDLFNNLKKVIDVILVIAIIFVFINFSSSVLNVGDGSGLSNAEKQGSAALNFVSLVLVIVTTTFGIVIIINSLFLYFYGLKKTNINLRILGFTSIKVILINLIESISVYAFGVILGAIPTIILAACYGDVIVLDKTLMWTLLFTLPIIPTLVIPLLNYRSFGHLHKK